MIFDEMIVALPMKEVSGSYDTDRQQWSEASEAQRSPQKHHQEN
ncbi:MAG TPA: hypothetical protein VEW93_01800 [Acidimicrobiales bacterium]|nr:hypothetical protein [Acidimicrobiales bacterium]